MKESSNLVSQRKHKSTVLLLAGLSEKGTSATSTKQPRLSTDRDAGNIVNKNA